LRLLTLSAIATAVVSAQAKDITVYVDGDPVYFANTGPRMMSNRVVVPLRGVFEKMGASVDWNESDQSITCTKAAKKIWLRIGDRNATIDGNNVTLDQPAVIYRGTTMVPLRFVSEALGADVKWNDSMQAVNITTGLNANNNGNNGNNGNTKTLMLDSGTVIPVVLSTNLSSNNSKEGDKFSAMVDTKGEANYAGIPKGSSILGHVSLARPKTSKDPGVLGLDYDALLLPDGSRVSVQGSQIGLDDKSVEMKDGKFVAKGVKSNDHKSVWIGAGAGAVLALITKGNILTDTVVGAALGYLYDTLHLGGSTNKDVMLKAGTEVGVRLDQDLIAKIGQ